MYLSMLFIIHCSYNESIRLFLIETLLYSSLVFCYRLLLVLSIVFVNEKLSLRLFKNNFLTKIQNKINILMYPLKFMHYILIKFFIFLQYYLKPSQCLNLLVFYSLIKTRFYFHFLVCNMTYIIHMGKIPFMLDTITQYYDQ